MVMDHPVDVTSRESEIWDGNGRTVRWGGRGFGTICIQAERLSGRRRDLREGDSRRLTPGRTSGFTRVGGERKAEEDFPGGAVVKNPPASAGDTGSSPGPGRSHMPCSN